MKLHLPLLLRGALLAVLMLPVQAALIWNTGNWNTSDESWWENGVLAVFSPGDAVEFTDAGDKTVTITEAVAPSSVQVFAPGYVFEGTGSITGGGSITLAAGASLTVKNANSFTGGTTVAEGATLILHRFNSVGTTNAGESATGVVSGAGTVVLLLDSPDSYVSIQGNHWQNMTGTLRIQRGFLGIGRAPGHAGPGAPVTMGTELVEVASAGRFVTSLGGGAAALETGMSFASDIRVQSGGIIGNRDGHVNWTGDVMLNVQNLDEGSSVFDATGSVEMAMFYAKYVVWNGTVSGSGELVITSGNSDTGADHRLVLTHAANPFTGTYRVNGAYLTTLALADSTAAGVAGVQLDTASSRLVLMNTNADITTLNGNAGVVMAEGNGAYSLTVGSGTYSGHVKDSAAAVAGLSLGIIKTGEGSLELAGPNCTYTGDTKVQGGSVHFNGDAALGNISLSGGTPLLTVEGNLTLRSSSALALDLTDRTAAAVQVGGMLQVSDTGHALQLSGYDELPTGNYELVTWGSSSEVVDSAFFTQGLNDTDALTYAVRVQGNSLQLVVGNAADVPWLWVAGSATWADDSTAQWQNSSGSGPAGQVVTFGPAHSGTVTMDRVTPSAIRVTGGEYTFAGVTPSSVGIVSGGQLSVSGDATVLKLGMANPSFSGSTVLLDGVVELGAENALGTSSLFFNGGQLRYGDGVSQDVSAQVQSSSVAQVRIDTNGNTISWADVNGVKHTLSCGVEKDGAGELSLNWSASNDTHAGDLWVNEGTLRITKLTGQGTLSGSLGGTGTLVLSSPNGQMNVLGNNSAFAGTLQLSGNGSANTGSVSFVNGASMGGEETLVQVAGQRFWFQTNHSSTAAGLEIMEGTTTYMDGSSGNTYTFTGAVSGSGTLILKPASNITMSGDVSAFTGRFEHPGNRAVAWLFGGAGVTGTGLVQADLASSGKQMSYIFQYEGDTVMSGDVSGSANLRQSGSGVLTLTGQSTTTGNLVVDAGSEIRLGNESTAGSWAGTHQTGTGTFTLVNGTLVNGLSDVEGTLVADVATGGRVDMGGMDANSLQSISIGAGGQLSGISGALHIGAADGVDSMLLTLAAENTGSTALLGEGEENMLEIEGGNLVIHDATTVELNLESVKSILEGKRQAVYLHLTNTDLQLQAGISAADLFANSSTTPEALGLVVLGVDGGNIVLEGDVRDVYMVMANGDYPTVTDYPRLQPYKATFVDSGYTLALNLPGDNTQESWVNNLLGAGDFTVSNTSETTGVVRVLLNNEVLGQVDSKLSPEQETEINTADTLFAGNISAGHAVQLVKTGSGKLTVGGALTADWLELDEGVIHLTGAGSRVTSLHGDSTLILDGELEIAGNSQGFSGNLSGGGSLVLNGSLPGSGSVGVLSGSGSLVAVGDTFVVQNVEKSTFSGNLTGEDSEGVLSVQSGVGQFTMSQVRATEAWTVKNHGNLIIQQAGDAGNALLTLGSLQLLDGSATSIVLDTDTDSQVFSLGSLLVQDGAAVTLQSTGSLPLATAADGTVVLGQVAAADLGADEQVPLTLGSGTPFRGLIAAWLSVQDGQLLLNTISDTTNQYAGLASTDNGAAGAQMLWNLPKEVLAENPDLSLLTQALDTMVDAGDSAHADRIMAAAAGAGAAVLGSALVGDLERQLKSIRNRTTSMGVDPAYEYDFPLFNVWVNAEGDYARLGAAGTDAGYSLSSWGGTVGFDVDISYSFTAGMAFTAMYGDFQSRSADYAEGDVDSYYLTLFGRYAARRWTHTLVGALGRHDVELNRSVDFGPGAYSTQGSTHGTSFGLLYELGYVIPLDDEGSACLQPHANISYRHVGLDSCNEQGSDAALHIGAQSMDVVTFGLGARAQTYALENLYNRSCLLEGRVLLKLDAGDTRSHCDMALLADRSRNGRVRAAETGRFGVEIGAGFAVPLGQDSGTIFLDAGVELRSDESELNGTVGYRLSF